MTDLLTTRQVQDILKVDRITIYRMLQDGRLKGVKIGQQWRFHSHEVERMLSGGTAQLDESIPSGDLSFPTHCIQTIQDLFAEISQISAFVLDMQGNLLTKISHSTSFGEMLLSSANGLNVYRAIWQSFVRDSVATNGMAGKKFFTCQAGLNYIGAPIMEKDSQIGLFVAGQFYWQSPEPREEAERIRRLAAEFHVPAPELQDAACDIPVIDPAQHHQVESWPFTAARAVESILHERLCFVDRLQQIANLTQL